MKGRAALIDRARGQAGLQLGTEDGPALRNLDGVQETPLDIKGPCIER